MLLSFEDEQSVEDETRSFAAERRVRFVANECAAEGDRACRDAARALLMNVQRTDVKRVERFTFELRVIDDCTVAGDELSHGVREVFARSAVRFDDRRFDAARDDNEIARMRFESVGGDEVQMDEAIE